SNMKFAAICLLTFASVVVSADERSAMADKARRVSKATYDKAAAVMRREKYGGGIQLDLNDGTKPSNLPFGGFRINVNYKVRTASAFSAKQTRSISTQLNDIFKNLWREKYNSVSNCYYNDGTGSANKNLALGEVNCVATFKP
ncbi:hypothetical protein PFISCL1PPCAC_21940, partial [Pristionchus fissidentatus]